MAIVRKYFDESWNEIQDISKESIYHVEIFEGDRKIKNEHFSEGILVGISYYISSLDEIPSLLVGTSDTCFIKEHTIRNHTIREYLDYKGGALIRKRVWVADSPHDNLICIQDTYYDSLTNLPVNTNIEKSYFNREGLEIYRFEYFPNGSCLHIHNMQEYQCDIYPDKIGVDPSIDFSWEGFEYYKYAEPIVPNTI